MHIGTLKVSKDITLTKQEKLNSIEIVKSELTNIVDMFIKINCLYAILSIIKFKDHNE